MDDARFDMFVRNAAGLTRRASVGVLLAAAMSWRSAAAGVEAEICLPNGQRCGRKAGGRGRPCRRCCSRFAPKAKGERHCACVPFGGKCGNRGQCCDAECNLGQCGCLGNGEKCKKDSNCCFAPCINGICRCLEDGDTCARDEECCFSYCVRGTCQCFAGGAACERDEECCDTPCIGGVCTWGTCEAGDEVCAGGSEPFDPFCGFSDCLCFMSTANALFCGDWFASPDECSACEFDDDCDAVTGPDSACVVAEDCCDLEGQGPATLCMPPCPESGLERAPRRASRRAEPHAVWTSRRGQQQKHQRRP